MTRSIGWERGPSRLYKDHSTTREIWREAEQEDLVADKNTAGDGDRSAM